MATLTHEALSAIDPQIEARARWNAARLKMASFDGEGLMVAEAKQLISRGAQGVRLYRSKPDYDTKHYHVRLRWSPRSSGSITASRQIELVTNQGEMAGIYVSVSPSMMEGLTLSTNASIDNTNRESWKDLIRRASLDAMPGEDLTIGEGLNPFKRVRDAKHWEEVPLN